MSKIDEYIEGLPEWQTSELRGLREGIHQAAPDTDEDWKWAVPVFSYKGKILFAISAFKGHVKINFLTGAGLDDQAAFNSGLDSKSHRSINLAEGESADMERVKALVRDAVRKADGE